jgi:hypothetical protein
MSENQAAYPLRAAAESSRNGNPVPGISGLKAGEHVKRLINGFSIRPQVDTVRDTPERNQDEP